MPQRTHFTKRWGNCHLGYSFAIGFKKKLRVVFTRISVILRIFSAEYEINSKLYSLWNNSQEKSEINHNEINSKNNEINLQFQLSIWGAFKELELYFAVCPNIQRSEVLGVISFWYLGVIS